jgi:tetratricopeptide (TPR) repeat protein
MTTWLKVSFLLLAQASCFCLASCAGQSTGEYVLDATDLMNAGKYDEAVSMCDRAISADSANDGAYVVRFGAYTHLNDVKHAMADITKAIELNPKHAQYYLYRAQFEGEQGDFHGKVEDMNKAVELDPQNAAYYWYRGEARLELAMQDDPFNQGLLDAAGSDFNQVLTMGDPAWSKAASDSLEMIHDIQTSAPDDSPPPTP